MNHAMFKVGDRWVINVATRWCRGLSMMYQHRHWGFTTLSFYHMITSIEIAADITSVCHWEGVVGLAGCGEHLIIQCEYVILIYTLW